MRVRGFFKDLMLLDVAIVLIVISVWTLYNYFTTYDTECLIWGLIAASVAVFAIIGRYRFVIDYVWTILKHLSGRTQFEIFAQIEEKTT